MEPFKVEAVPAHGHDTREPWRRWLLRVKPGQPAAQCVFTATRTITVTAHQGEGGPVNLGPGDMLAISFNPVAVWAAAMDTPFGATGLAWEGDPAADLRAQRDAHRTEIDRLQTLLAAIPDELGGDWAAQVRQETRVYNGE